MNAVSVLMMLVLFGPVSAMVALNLVLYRAMRYVRQPAMPASLPARKVVVTELPEAAVALQRAYELRQAA